MSAAELKHKSKATAVDICKNTLENNNVFERAQSDLGNPSNIDPIIDVTFINQIEDMISDSFIEKEVSTPRRMATYRQ